MPLSVVAFVHWILGQTVDRGDVCVDATLGGGRDTLVLARLVGDTGHVFGFDVQDAALTRTRKLLEAHHLVGRATLVRAGHEHAAEHLPGEVRGRLGAVVFNLGFLPGADRSVVTRERTTLEALDALWPLLRPGGVITAVAYPGHPGGAGEADAVRAWVERVARTGGWTAVFEPLATAAPAPRAFVLRRPGAERNRRTAE